MASKVIVCDRELGGLWVKSFRVEGKQMLTHSYSKWLSIVSRCSGNERFLQKHPTYSNCTMSETFRDFNTFAAWHVNQIGYAIDGYQLDKDILCGGRGKVYSEDTCVLIPQALNKFLTARDALRGDYPQGVSFNKHSGKFVARLSVDGIGRVLGSYDLHRHAADVYKIAKEAEALRWYRRLLYGEFVVDARVTACMKSWTYNETPHI